MSGLVLREDDVVKLACEFLQNRELHISQVLSKFDLNRSTSALAFPILSNIGKLEPKKKLFSSIVSKVEV
jgi:hypothetical protein